MQRAPPWMAVGPRERRSSRQSVTCCLSCRRRFEQRHEPPSRAPPRRVRACASSRSSPAERAREQAHRTARRARGRSSRHRAARRHRCHPDRERPHRSGADRAHSAEAFPADKAVDARRPTPSRARCTAPKDRVVSVGQIIGCSATAGGTPFPPSSPARTSIRASIRQRSAHDDHQVPRRFPKAVQ